MAAGHVNRTELEANYQPKGELYDNDKTEGAFEVVAQQVDDNWDDYKVVKDSLNSTTNGASGAHYVKSAAISGVTGGNVYAQLADIFTQLKNASMGVVPDGSVTDAKLSAAAGQILARFAAHENEDVTLNTVHGLRIESGVFSPVIAGATTPGTNTYSVQHGSYYLIGKLIHCDIRLALSAKDGAMAGAVSITNLPKVSKNTTNKYVAATISRITNITLTAVDNNLVATLLPNLSSISLQQVGSAKVVANLDSTAISGNTEIVISVTYEIN